MKVDPEKQHIAMNVALVADDVKHAEAYCIAMSVLMDVPERLPPVDGITAAQTGGLVEPKKNTANKVIHSVLTHAWADPSWSFELYFTALTPKLTEAMHKAARTSVRGTLDTFVMVNEQSIATNDPEQYLHPVLSACAPRLMAARRQAQAK